MGSKEKLCAYRGFFFLIHSYSYVTKYKQCYISEVGLINLANLLNTAMVT